MGSLALLSGDIDNVRVCEEAVIRDGNLAYKQGMAYIIPPEYVLVC